MYTDNLIPVENILVRPEIMETHFSCDLEKCKGACCTIESEFGAPLLDEEIPVIKEILEDVFPYLPEEHVNLIKKDGFFHNKDGESDLSLSSERLFWMKKYRLLMKFLKMYFHIYRKNMLI